MCFLIPSAPHCMRAQHGLSTLQRSSLGGSPQGVGGGLDVAAKDAGGGCASLAALLRDSACGRKAWAACCAETPTGLQSCCASSARVHKPRPQQRRAGGIAGSTLGRSSMPARRNDQQAQPNRQLLAHEVQGMLCTLCTAQHGMSPQRDSPKQSKENCAPPEGVGGVGGVGPPGAGGVLGAGGAPPAGGPAGVAGAPPPAGLVWQAWRLANAAA